MNFGTLSIHSEFELITQTSDEYEEARSINNAMIDGFFPSGLHWYRKGYFVSEISVKAVKEYIRFATIPTPLATMQLYPIGGTVYQVGKDVTAWTKCNTGWSMVIVGLGPDNGNSEKLTTWARDYWEALHPYSFGGSYIHFTMEEGQDRVEASHGDHYNRLQKFKVKYEPDNFSQVNQNIKPES